MFTIQKQIIMKKKSNNFQKDPLVVSLPGGKGKITVDMRLIKRAALSLRALNNPLREKLLELIERNGKIGVTELYSKLKIEQSVASQHLAILRRAQVVNAKRDGRKISYSINGKRIAEIIKLASAL